MNAHLGQTKARQSAKIAEIRDALVAAEFVTTTSQAAVLGLSRSTTWAIFQGTHKGSGLSGSVIKRMLRSERLPWTVRDKIMEYCSEKSAGVYGHSRRRLRVFDSQLMHSGIHPPENTRVSIDAE
jgi:hypothetical protein